MRANRRAVNGLGSMNRMKMRLLQLFFFLKRECFRRDLEPSGFLNSRVYPWARWGEIPGTSVV